MFKTSSGVISIDLSMYSPVISERSERSLFYHINSIAAIDVLVISSPRPWKVEGRFNVGLGYLRRELETRTLEGVWEGGGGTCTR